MEYQAKRRPDALFVASQRCEMERRARCTCLSRPRLIRSYWRRGLPRGATSAPVFCAGVPPTRLRALNVPGDAGSALGAQAPRRPSDPRPAGAYACPQRRLDHCIDNIGIVPHAEIIVGAPDHDFTARAASAPACGRAACRSRSRKCDSDPPGESRQGMIENNGVVSSHAPKSRHLPKSRSKSRCLVSCGSLFFS